MRDFYVVWSRNPDRVFTVTADSANSAKILFEDRHEAVMPGTPLPKWITVLTGPEFERQYRALARERVPALHEWEGEERWRG